MGIIFLILKLVFFSTKILKLNFILLRIYITVYIYKHSLSSLLVDSILIDKNFKL